MNDNYFHFTLGPVQTFVAQARRTRDFWAGSFILSWLSSVAMLAVRKQHNGIILFPQADEAFMKALEAGSKSGPKQGNVPNRFKARVEEGFVPDKITAAVQQAWIELAEHIWKADLAGVAEQQNYDKEIWDRQITGFWDMQWALVPDKHESNILDRLKNWRTHLLSDEPGVKCMMMDGWQELSGAQGPGRREDDPDGPAGFWNAVRNNKEASAIASDLRESEMLCAIAFVKRRFARHFPSFNYTMPDGWTLQGWRLSKGVPSVHYMAAAHWLESLIKEANKDQGVNKALWDFHNAARKLTGEYGEWDSNIRCIREVVDAKAGQHRWEALNGEVFFESMLENERLWQSKAGESQALADLLRSLQKKANIGPVTLYYAVVMMDGDELGIQMSDPIKQDAITQGLAQFTGGVADIVAHHNGFLIYAGGDDVLAVLPIDDALRCAAELRKHYLDCFDSQIIPTTLSGAIEYAHAKMPLGKVLGDAHDLLENIAKERCGRDAIACRVWKPGGQTLEWALPWRCALENGDANGPVVIDRLAVQFRTWGDEGERDMAGKFFHRIRERFDLLNPSNDDEKPVLDRAAATDLLAMEYLNSGVVRGKAWDMKRATEAIQPLLDQCYPVIRDKNIPDCSDWNRLPRLEADGALLVRFLADKGVE